MSDLMLFDLGGVDVTIPEWIKTKNFRLAESIDDVKEYVDKCITNKLCALDLETQGLDNRVYENPETGRLETVHKIVGFCICADENSAIYVPVRHKNGNNLDVELVEKEIARMINHPDTIIIFHNAKFDCEFLEFMTSPCPMDDHNKFEDTLIADFIKDPNSKRHGLKTLSKLYLDLVMIELKELFPPKTKNLDFSELNPSNRGVTEYGCSDAYCTYMIWKNVLYEIPEKYTAVYKVEKRVVPALRRMERPRVKINRKLIIELQRGAEQERMRLASKFEEESKPLLKEGETRIDILSPKQLSELFYSRIGIQAPQEAATAGKTSQISTSQDILDKIQKRHPDKYPILKTVTDYRTIDGVISKYLSNLAVNIDDNDEARLGFNGWNADTARLSSSGGPPDHGYTGVNWHSLPKPNDVTKPIFSRRIREAVEARMGYALVKIDFSGEELRIAANVSKEPKWIKEFLEGEGDLHSLMAIEIFGSKEGNNRSYAKNTNFALLYGGGVSAVQRNTKLPSHEAKRIVEKFFSKLPVLRKWRDGQKEKARRDKLVFTDLGRPLPLPQMDSDDPKIRAYGERKSINSPIQGAGADIIKFAMGEIDKTFREKGWYPDIARMLINVHDEIVFEIKLEHLEEVVPVCCECMVKYYKVRNWKVPLVVEPLIGLDWSAKHDWLEMKAGEEPVPDWLAPYFKTDKDFVGDEPEVKMSEKKPQKVISSTDLLVREADEMMTYILKAPLNDVTLTTLKNVCRWSRVPLVAPAKTLLIVTDPKDKEEIIGGDLDIRVDAYKFRVLADLFGL